jgi:RimJ/RimL family protein N-acetyltransferase
MISEDIILENNRVKLSPLTLENYHQLIPVASQEKLVQYSPLDIRTPQALRNYVELVLQGKEKHKTYPFIVYNKATANFAGCTNYLNIDWKNKVLEIGSTWIGKEYHGSGLNGEMKKLMLDYAFGDMGFEKVSFRIDERNIRSRKAVEKLGGVLEGVLRKNVYLLDGYKRNTCCYGLLKEEWGGDHSSFFIGSTSSSQ